mmetsp:Transcript_14770/g.31293  ORF Transcript_14770/g.31293 Transcript_14770/m.31293 type:complete len:238 (+) Transcript_14770:3-716(+)
MAIDIDRSIVSSRRSATSPMQMHASVITSPPSTILIKQTTNKPVTVASSLKKTAAAPRSSISSFLPALPRNLSIRRRINTSKLASNTGSFLTTFLVAIAVVSIYDNAKIVHEVLRLRGNAAAHPSFSEPRTEQQHKELGKVLFNDTSSKPIPDNEQRRVVLKKELFTSCDKHNTVDKCNGSKDNRGIECRRCTDYLLVKELCVADDSEVYKFAPCNNWICYNDEEPLKRDMAACESF